MRRTIKVEVEAVVDFDVELDRENMECRVTSARVNGRLDPPDVMDALKKQPSERNPRRMSNLDVINDLVSETGDKVHLWNTRHEPWTTVCGLTKDGDKILGTTDAYALGVGIDDENACQDCLQFIQDALERANQAMRERDGTTDSVSEDSNG
jgi:hypothetical protein